MAVIIRDREEARFVVRLREWLDWFKEDQPKTEKPTLDYADTIAIDLLNEFSEKHGVHAKANFAPSQTKRQAPGGSEADER